MGCKTKYSSGESSPCFRTNHCSVNVPLPVNQATTVEFREHPLAVFRNSNTNYQIDRRDSVAIMHESIALPAVPAGGGSPPASGAICGKVFRSAGCVNISRWVYDYVPNELSFDLGLSDRYFSYLYDTSNNAGHVGIACYYLETRNDTNTSASTPPSGTEGQPGYVPGQPGTSTSTESIICKPCTAFTCAPSKTTMSYSGTENISGDPDAPHPTLFAIGTDSDKVVVSYDSLSTTIPDGVTDMEFSYDGVTYTDVWDQTTQAGIEYESPQNPFVTGQNQLNDFEIYNLDVGLATGLRIKVGISSIADDTATPGPTYSGVRWQITELMNTGADYTVGTVIPLTYAYTKPDNTVVNLTMNLKITGVGPTTSVTSQAGFNILRVGDTLNGHTVTRAFHTDIDNFPYHVIYLNGSGSDFVKDTQYTSDRNHVVTAHAGFGIVDRGIIVGKYEFLDKSIQYSTIDVDKNAPDVFNTLKQPKVTLSVSNGQVTGATIVSGGSGWSDGSTLSVSSPQDNTTFELDANGNVEKVIIKPADESNIAKLEGTFTNGSLTAVTVVDGGKGYNTVLTNVDGDGNEYTEENLPTVFVSDIVNYKTITALNAAYEPEKADDYMDTISKFPQDISPELENQIFGGFDQDPKYVNNIPASNITQKRDPERLKIDIQPQRLYSKKSVDEYRETYELREDLTEEILAVDIDSSVKNSVLKGHIDETNERIAHADALVQEVIPESTVGNEALIETVQGTFNDLPVASTYTKYFMKQYRPDSSGPITLKITLGCEVAQAGCGHVPCAPVQSIGSSTTNADGSTDVTTFTPQVGPLGGGCRNWTATGSLEIFNDLTGSAQTFREACDAFGNPYAT